jgi:hypothetical protein
VGERGCQKKSEKPRCINNKHASRRAPASSGGAPQFRYNNRDHADIFDEVISRY